ncbi:MAG: hypothetical protein ACPGU1_19120 [Myxococcota bacterium]
MSVHSFLALLATFAGSLCLIGCGDQSDHHDPSHSKVAAEQRAELSELRTQVTTLQGELKAISTRFDSMETVTRCVEQRVKAMQAWSKHRPKWDGYCKEVRGRCRGTGLRPRSITPYRARLRTIFNLINAANFKAAASALDKLKFPVPTVDSWYERQKISKAAWLEMRVTAEQLTRTYLTECGGVETAMQPGATAAAEVHSTAKEVGTTPKVDAEEVKPPSSRGP